MRALAVWLLALGLALTPVAAGARTADEKKNTAEAKKPDAKPEEPKKSTEKTKEEGAKPSSTLEKEILELKALIQAQADELAAQREALRQQQVMMDALSKQFATPQPVALRPSVPAPTNASSAPAGAASSADPGSVVLTAGTVGSPAPKPNPADEEGPASIKFKGITLTPGGFFVAETVWRQRGLAADVNTPFNSVPFSGSSQAHLSEFNASGRQSRISMLAEGKVGSAKIGGYYETDFLGAGTPSNNNQSNSYVLRQRQFWARAVFDNGWGVVGGQMWSLVTETKKGVDNRTEATPMTIDAQYTIGFSWARQFGFRVYKNFNNKFWLAASVEGAQTTLTAHGNTNNFLIAAPGAGGGLFNNQANYSFNTIPDFVVKAVMEPGWGHYELFGVVGAVRSREFPCATASVASPCTVGGTQFTAPNGLGAINDRRISGGVGANIRVPVQKKADLGLHAFVGDGVGRYGTGGLSVATVRPNGSLSLLHSYQALGTAEIHATPKLDLYFNFGMEYASRARYLNAAGGAVGYGSQLFSNAGCNTEILPTNQNTPAGPGTCTGDTKALVEGTFGLWYRFYKGNYGTLQWGPQYSYVVRTTWTGASATAGIGVAPHATENMIFTSFRYYIP